jgi:hypothetical protein
MPVVYRDNGTWGSGLLADLSAPDIDGNFWTLVSEIADIQATIGSGSYAGIDYFTIEGDQLYVTLTDHTTLGPYTFPTAAWDAGPGPAVQFWAASTAYAVNAVFQNDGSLYLVRYPDPGQPTFDPNANDGLGHNYFNLLLANPSNVLPTGGAAGSFLVKASSADFAVEWQTVDEITSALPIATPSQLGVVYGVNGVTSEWVSYFDPHGHPVLSRPAFSDISGLISPNQLIEDAFQSLPSVGGVLTINWANGANVELVMSEDITSIVISDWPVAYLAKITLFITNGGAYTVTNWAGALWPGGIAPTVGTNDIITLIYDGYSTVIRGAVVGQSYS